MLRVLGPRLAQSASVSWNLKRKAEGVDVGLGIGMLCKVLNRHVQNVLEVSQQHAEPGLYIRSNQSNQSNRSAVGSLSSFSLGQGQSPDQHWLGVLCSGKVTTGQSVCQWLILAVQESRPQLGTIGSPLNVLVVGGDFQAAAPNFALLDPARPNLPSIS